jgi:hypothetical protein
MRTRFEGTWFDERSDVGAGPFHAEYRARPLLWKSGGQQYLNERTVGVQQNAFHFVATPRHNVPAPIGGLSTIIAAFSTEFPRNKTCEFRRWRDFFCLVFSEVIAVWSGQA